MADEAPSEFLCPISAALMADPVTVPTGESFERSCVHACLDLAFTPPSLSHAAHALDLSTSASTSPLLIPNVALRNAILSWAVRSLLTAGAGAGAGAEAGLRRQALKVVASLAGTAEGRGALMDEGAVVGMMRELGEGEEYCVAALRGMSRGSVRFRGRRGCWRGVAEGGGGGRVRREMARMTLRAMREDAAGDDDAAEEGDESLVSEGLLPLRRRRRRRLLNLEVDRVLKDGIPK